jgi:hypothetical protein
MEISVSSTRGLINISFHVWWSQEVLELEEVERHGAIIERHEFGRAVAGASPIDYGASVTPWNWSSTRGDGAHSPAAPDNIWLAGRFHLGIGPY